MKSVKWIKFVGAAILIVILGVYVSFYMGGSTSRNRQAEHRLAPAFSLKDHLGHPHTLEEARGKLVIVHFWASWCPPCLQEAPDLVSFATQFEGKPLEIFAISLDENWENAEKILTTEKLPKNMTSLIDLSTKVPDAYGTYQYPETYLVGGDGRIIAKWIGAQPWTTPGMQRVIDEAIARLKSS